MILTNQNYDEWENCPELIVLTQFSWSHITYFVNFLCILFIFIIIFLNKFPDFFKNFLICSKFPCSTLRRCRPFWHWVFSVNYKKSLHIYCSLSKIAAHLPNIIEKNRRTFTAQSEKYASAVPHFLPKITALNTCPWALVIIPCITKLQPHPLKLFSNGFEINFGFYVARIAFHCIFMQFYARFCCTTHAVFSTLRFFLPLPVYCCAFLCTRFCSILIGPLYLHGI